IAQRILEDTLHNIIHDVVIRKHHEHKLMLTKLDPSTRLPHCETCKLPRLLDPPLAPKVRGATSDPPTSTIYCDLRPWSRRPGHDIYGNPFLKSDVTGRPMSKKEREAAAKNSKGEGTPASEDANDQNGANPGSPSHEDGNGAANNTVKLEKGEKKASKIDEKLRKGEYVPWHTCPSCKRSLLITRFAKHLEQCMGLSGRAASRNAMAKMNNGATPAGSRGGTPNPSQDAADDDDDDAALSSKSNGGLSGAGSGGGGVRKKLLKKGLKDKAKKEGVGGTPGGGATGKIPKSLAPPSRVNGARSSPAPSGTGDGKRDRDELNDGGDEDDDDDEVHVKKRQKLQRVASTTSIVSQSTATAAEMERGESNDGSFVGDG
ncbi:uncharacterized protein K489DRAFT_292621, partial [Dissoconium aciculare CBS 342.82]|uniref:SAGA-associated factor 11 n=1 Tax=Dissoconium aciculare CBS 342.82 TaxID=1314786 RepID=A0A6J3MIB7_9PEZI